MDPYIYEQCKKDKEILKIKIGNLEHAIKQSEAMLSESKIDESSLSFLKRKIASSIQDLETLYLLKRENG